MAKSWQGVVKIKMLHRPGSTVLLPEAVVVTSARDRVLSHRDLVRDHHRRVPHRVLLCDRLCRLCCRLFRPCQIAAPLV